MKMTLSTCAMAAALLAVPGLPGGRPDLVAASDSPATTLHDAMRKLWTDHVAWTRMYIISAAAGAPDLAATTDRLLQNQSDIGNAVSTYYGAGAGAKLTALLKEHILQAAELVKLSKAGDPKAADVKARWYKNADDIAVFLSGANPKHWPVATLKDAMKTHLDQTLKEAGDRLAGKYAEDIKDYEAIVAHILTMADLLSSGIVAQFPRQFKGAKS